MVVSKNLIQLLKKEFSLSADQIAWGLKQTEAMPSYLPVIFWQYGLIDTSQLDRLLDYWG
ncbi:DUF2949 domain-containing protein [Synechocystis sp. FACHB-383]|uniref:DUF2949 domain-containing protein n=1 Tax=Synechocystis sp. FACHB-383 TaxID=2692864 RepID=UPI0016896D30|nr:DUF2949 domain-containing protein [Synechocystis sp. FACHB-383]MBD2652268.1 DUF2949 domain-containing protein [Synechocystis sp. FACHB-383]